MKGKRIKIGKEKHPKGHLSNKRYMMKVSDFLIHNILHFLVMFLWSIFMFVLLGINFAKFKILFLNFLIFSTLKLKLN